METTNPVDDVWWKLRTPYGRGHCQDFNDKILCSLGFFLLIVVSYILFNWFYFLLISEANHPFSCQLCTFFFIPTIATDWFYWFRLMLWFIGNANLAVNFYEKKKLYMISWVCGLTISVNTYSSICEACFMLFMHLVLGSIRLRILVDAIFFAQCVIMNNLCNFINQLQAIFTFWASS